MLYFLICLAVIIVILGIIEIYTDGALTMMLDEFMDAEAY